MTPYNTLLSVLLAIGIGIAVGHLLFQRKGAASVQVYSGLGTVTGTFWVITGIFMVIGGFRKSGAIVIAFAYFLARGNFKRFQTERSARTRLANGRG